MIEFWIDRGGTFTDVIARGPDGSLRTTKVLSNVPGRRDDAAIVGMTELAADMGYASLADTPIAAIRMGTTVATNALLERAGEPTALVITAGLRDALLIGEQHRPDIFALNPRRPAPLFSCVIEAEERIGPHGDVVTPLHTATLGDALKRAAAAGLRSVAVALLHAYRNPHHEQQVARLARAAGFAQISMSHEVSGLARLVGRGDTTVVDAYLTPVLQRYIRDVERGVGARHAGVLRFMQSNGGLTRAGHFRGANSVLSGPAGGVVGMARTAAAAGIDRVIGFDMGGTSTDIALYDRSYERRTDNVIDGVRLQTPMLRVHTIAAGGGSILDVRDGRLLVGPASAGAHPGPRCYRNNGPLAVTDIQACLGRLQPDLFPRVFGPTSDQPIDPDASRAGFVQIGRLLGTADSTAEEVAAKFLDVAIDTMALAVRRAALSRGIDVDRFALASFGGAAGQHACAVAAALGLGTVLIHPQASVLSALGIGLADHRAVRLMHANVPLTHDALTSLRAASQPVADELIETMDDVGRARVERRLALRLAGSDTTLDVADGPLDEVVAEFQSRHSARFGFAGSDDIVIDAVSIEAIEDGAAPPPDSPDRHEGRASQARRRVWFDGRWQEVPLWPRHGLGDGDTVLGPGLIVEPHSTIVLEAGWRAESLPDGQLRLSQTQANDSASRDVAEAPCDPGRLEQFNNLFVHIAGQMGAVLQHTARSVNIKERLDFSCALFDRHGKLLANAPHMPVHLGSMGDSVSAVRRAFPMPSDGDSFVLNDPFEGGTHLPDITVVTPFFGGHRAPLFYLASRGHHADVGGITPGSMPADSRHIDDEGILLKPMLLACAGQFNEDGLRSALGRGPHPARNIDQNLADLKAQLAANRTGRSLLETMLDERGVATSLAYAAHVQDNAELAVREVIAGQTGGHHVVEMDGGQRIEVAVTINGDRAVVDFAGTSAQTDDNFNAPRSVCRAAVLYVFRCLVARPIPMNAGCLAPIDLRIPDGCFLAPSSPAAVAAGNVETSMCVTEALFGALGVLAAGQGTMNNVTFGNDSLQYYETLCGGAGAGDGFDGCSAIHTHMTNSRLTDPEIVEQRFGVRVTRFCLREGSGGAGRWRGGDGLVREYEFLTPMTVSLLTNRRRRGPFGLKGGQRGRPGKNTLIRSYGGAMSLASTARIDVHPGDRLRIETPGGGGFGVAT